MTNVRDWYKKEYPTDDYAEDIKANITFEDIIALLLSDDNYEGSEEFYSVVGDVDSVIRERIFDKLADLYKVSYDTIYDAWLGNKEQLEIELDANKHRFEALKRHKLNKYSKQVQRRIDEKFNGMTIGLGGVYNYKRALYESIKVKYDTKAIVLQEGVKTALPDDLLGGIIVVSTDVNSVRQSNNRLINYLKQKFLTTKQRLTRDRKVTNVLKDRQEEVGWTVGNFLKGRYIDDSGNVFDEKSFCIEINGVSNQTIIDIATKICKDFNQETVLVKLYNPPRILFVDGN